MNSLSMPVWQCQRSSIIVFWPLDWQQNFSADQYFVVVFILVTAENTCCDSIWVSGTHLYSREWSAHYGQFKMLLEINVSIPKSIINCGTEKKVIQVDLKSKYIWMNYLTVKMCWNSLYCTGVVTMQGVGHPKTTMSIFIFLHWSDFLLCSTEERNIQVWNKFVDE